MLGSRLALVSQTRGRPSTSPQLGAKLDLESKPVSDFSELLLSHHTTVDVTLGTREGIFTGRLGQASPDLVVVRKTASSASSTRRRRHRRNQKIVPDWGRQARGFSRVEANPTGHICGIRRGCWVMKNGTLCNSGNLYAAVGIQPAEQVMGRPGS
jgi:hypothetical protein